MENSASLDLDDLLRRTFGYSAFRDQQRDIIEHVISGHDALVIMPTGGGKSLCYQIPALAMDGLAIVISPLIALMEDQVMALRQNGVNARCLHSGIAYDEKQLIFDQLQKGEVSLLYMSPETALQERFLAYAQRHLDICLLAIDEAHCVSIWGNDFRKEYAGLHVLKQRFSQTPMLALTATADRATQSDIVEKLGLSNARTYISSFERANIALSCRPGQKRIEQIKQLLASFGDVSGIIYCLSRKGTESLASKLSDVGYVTAAYHAGMSYDERQAVQKAFQEDKTRIVCATIAFGMGIDKHNIRFVIHYNMPKTIEGYYQEIGRAGRDGLDAQAVLFYSWGDYVQLRRFIDEGDASTDFKQVQLAKLERMWQFAESVSCRTNAVLHYFGEYRDQPCGRCDNCNDPPMVIDGTILAQKVLSCVVRAREELGMDAIMAMLKGHSKPDLTQRNLHHTTTFGVGRDLPYIQWRVYIQQMINQGLLFVDFIDGYTLKCTPLSKPVLRGQTKVDLKAYVPPKQRQANMKKQAAKATRPQLWYQLDAWRKKEARDASIPPQMVLSDATIDQLVKKRPVFASYLSSIDGLSEVKLDKYSEQLIHIIREDTLSHDQSKRVKGLTYLETLALYATGLKAQEIAVKRDCSVITVYGHMAFLFEQGENLDLSPYVSDQMVEDIRAAWVKLEKTDERSELKAALDHRYDYGLLAMAMAIIKRRTAVDS